MNTRTQLEQMREPREQSANMRRDPGPERDIDMLVGGFGELNHEHSDGIEHYRLSIGGDGDAQVAIRRVGLVAAMPSPTWLVAEGAPAGDMVVAVLENTSEIATLRIVRDGANVGDADHGSGASGHASADGAACLPVPPDDLRLVEERRVRVRGAGPTHAIIARDDQGARRLLAANYADGSISVHPMDERGVVLEPTQLLTGSGAGPLPAQEGPHAHWLLQVPDGRVLSTDLGADIIHVHEWREGELHRTDSVRLAPGTGPRDMHMLPSGGRGWRVAVVDEWGKTVTLLSSEPDIHVVQTVELGGDDNDQAASMAYMPAAVLNGEASSDATPYPGFAYVGLRGSERIVTLSWDGSRLQRLEYPWIDDWRGRGISCGGSRPRQLLALDDVLLAADEASDNLAAFLVSADGRPRLVSTVAAASPTVMLPLYEGSHLVA